MGLRHWALSKSTLCLSSPPPATTCTWAPLQAAAAGGTLGRGVGGGPLGGWKSASPTPAQRHRAPQLSELGCECILTPHTPRSVPARRASRAYVRENKWFRFMFKKLFTFPSKPGNRGHAIFCRCLSDGPTTSFFTTSHPRSCDVASLNGRCFFSGSWLGFCGLGAGSLEYSVPQASA